MWGDIIIGDVSPWMCSASHVEALPGGHNIAHNSCDFWISECLLGMGMKVAKSSDEGKALQAMIDSGSGLEPIQAMIDGWVLRLMSADVLRERIMSRENSLYKSGYEDGKRVKTAEIRKCLGVG